ncbi:MAG: ATP-dependent RNA helicase, partial [Treponema sp.]|nr:ATP-dependent RNA helicase [Treponema sp.]
MEYKTLPVYEQKNRILDALRENQVVVVQSPTGSGKTTQIPIILHEAGYDQTGMIAVTQPRRIAALSVSEFISKQLGTTYPGLVGYKMRFEDKTDLTTKIKIMTDGILLQEMKLDPWLSKYSVMMVDEAHERSLNIDFVLGLLKRVLKERREFKVIVSSATMNAEAFQDYFGGCPIVTIDTVTYPITMVYDSPKNPTTTLTDAGCDELLGKICDTVQRILDNDRDASGNGNANGGILIFLPGEKIIKDCMRLLDKSHFASRIHTLPLYGRLSKEDQERVFLKAPHGKKKIIISTNIAETSVTIPDITAVIDSGLAKLNFYNPHTFTSSLIETQVSRASCNQRRGRAGRTAPGTCYRLYSKKDFDTRSMYTTEEIYRTDLSEVVLQMADLGITNFKGFDFISSPGVDGIDSAVETLNMLGALNEDNTLSSIGKMMVRFPLEPRVSRIIVESIMHYPSVLKEALVASSFLSANSPYILPPGEEMEARKAHHSFRDIHGDFVSFLNMFDAFEKCTTPDAKAKFCKQYYLDERILLEIENIDKQLSEIVSEMNIPISSGGDKADYLSCIASGMIQFVCVRTGKNKYKSLTQDHICIHPGSVMFRQDPLYIVAGEIVRTSRMFAMSVSPLT